MTPAFIIPVDSIKAELLGLFTMKTGFRPIIALLLLFVTIIGILVSFGEDALCGGEPPGAHGRSNHPPAADGVQNTDGHCPCAPSPSTTPNDHFCTGDCGCPCQAPLSSAMLTVGYSPAFANLRHAEVTRHIPEVYLDRFIPPQNQA